MIEIIEPADPRADLDALAALEAITFRNPWTRQMLRVEFEQVEAVVAYVVRTEAHSVAAYCAGRVLGEELHVRNLAVHPDSRRRGIGTRLLAQVFRVAAEQGALRATLVVRASNEPARRLYASAGFQERDRRPGYYSCPPEDAVIFWRESL